MGPLGTLAAITAACYGFWYWRYQWLEPVVMSGDKFYMRQKAFTDLPVSPPYCWRPLLPWLARIFGFKFVSYSAAVALPFVVYHFAGGSWTGLACALIFVGNPHIGMFHMRNPEYGDAVGMLIFTAAVWAVYSEAWWIAAVLALVGALTRETITLGLAPIVVAVAWWTGDLAPLAVLPAAAVGSLIAWWQGNEDRDNRHPLIESSAFGTIKRWVRVKHGGLHHYCHTVQPLRAAPVAVPFVFESVGDLPRLGLLGCFGIWVGSIPASGQSRIICYALPLFVPFAAALEPSWLWLLAGAAFFWPWDGRVFDESGGKTFGYTR